MKNNESNYSWHKRGGNAAERDGLIGQHRVTDNLCQEGRWLLDHVTWLRSMMVLLSPLDIIFYNFISTIFYLVSINLHFLTLQRIQKGRECLAERKNVQESEWIKGMHAGPAAAWEGLRIEHGWAQALVLHLQSSARRIHCFFMSRPPQSLVKKQTWPWTRKILKFLSGTVG